MHDKYGGDLTEDSHNDDSQIMGNMFVGTKKGREQIHYKNKQNKKEDKVEGTNYQRRFSWTDSSDEGNDVIDLT